MFNILICSRGGQSVSPLARAGWCRCGTRGGSSSIVITIITITIITITIITMTTATGGCGWSRGPGSRVCWPPRSWGRRPHWPTPRCTTTTGTTPRRTPSGRTTALCTELAASHPRAPLLAFRPLTFIISCHHQLCDFQLIPKFSDFTTATTANNLVL